MGYDDLHGFLVAFWTIEVPVSDIRLKAAASNAKRPFGVGVGVGLGFGSGVWVRVRVRVRVRIRIRIRIRNRVRVRDSGLRDREKIKGVRDQWLELGIGLGARS